MAPGGMTLMNSIRTRVVLVVTFTSLLTVLAVMATTYQSLFDDFRAMIVQQEVLETRRLTEKVNQNLRKRVVVLSAARSLLIQDGQLRSPDELEAIIKQQPYLNRFFPDGVLVFDANGTAIAENTHVPGRLGTNYADRDHFKRILETHETVISEPIMGRTTGVPLLSFLVPVKQEGAFLGMIGGIIKLGEGSILPARSVSGQNERVITAILDTENRLYIESPGANPEERLNPLPEPGENPLIDTALGISDSDSETVFKHQRYLVATDAVEELNWTFVRAIPYQQAMTPLTSSFRQFLVIVAGVTVLLLVLAWLVARSLTNPLTRVTRQINTMAETPEEGASVSERGPREIRDLARAFNHLTGERQQLDELKNDFIASVSHELRTPLTSIEGGLKMMVAGVGGSLPVKSQSMAEIALRNSEQLNGLIRDLLDFNKLASGQRTFDFEPCNAAHAINQALEGNGAMASMYQVSLQMEAAPTLWVAADATALRQVLDNLISNAIKHSPAMGIVRVAAEAGRSGMVTITVSDQGDGVPEAFTNRIFQRFAQAERGTTRSGTGTGLGLAISRGLVHEMNGEIGFFNDHGAHFWLTLPQATPGG